jgi:hypothetical protein
MKHFSVLRVFTYERPVTLEKYTNENERKHFMACTKLPPIVEDLHNHAAAQVTELRALLNANAPSRPDPRRPGFFEVDGRDSVFYIFRYPSGCKVLLLGVWERDTVAEMAACAATAA